jgi:hypothetical protein
MRYTRALCDDAALGIELALADVEFSDGRLAHKLLTREVRRAITRSFSAAGFTAQSGTPHGQQDGINFGPGAPGAGGPMEGSFPDGEGETPNPGKRKKGGDGTGCWCCCEGCDCCCDCDDCCCDCS